LSFASTLWFECYANTLNANRIALVVELHTRDANARKIAPRNEARKKVKLPVGATCSPRVKNALDLVWISWLGLHHDPKTLQLERHHFSPSGLLTLFQTEQTEGFVPSAPPPSTNILFSQATGSLSSHHERLKKLFVSSRRRDGIEVPGEYTIVDHM
jgi:hypothetical protein